MTTSFAACLEAIDSATGAASDEANAFTDAQKAATTHAAVIARD